MNGKRLKGVEAKTCTCSLIAGVVQSTCWGPRQSVDKMWCHGFCWTSHLLNRVLCCVLATIPQGLSPILPYRCILCSKRGMCPQGADSLEVVHRHTPPVENAPPTTSSQAVGAGRRGIHAFGKCYIPYTSRGNKEVQFPSWGGNTTIMRVFVRRCSQRAEARPQP